MDSEFDRVIDRTGTSCLKYDFMAERGMPADVLPMWVADMDFRAPEAVLRRLKQAVEHGVFGYTETTAAYTRAVIGWFDRRFQWRPEEKWLVKTPGVVFALAAAVRAMSKPGDHVVIQTPVYYPFSQVIRSNGRVVLENELAEKNGRYEMDFADLEEKLSRPDTTLMLLCSPHNPVGRVWTVEELRRVGELCRTYGVILVSDEIHCDFTRPGHVHTPLLKAVPELAGQAVVCTAPSKTFNLAGLQASNIWIADEKLRRAMLREIAAAGYSQLNTMGILACQAAYEEGEEWLERLKAYLEGNLAFLRGFLRTYLPEIRLIEPEGTYLVWLDCSGLGLRGKALNDFMARRAGLWLDGGTMFGGSAEQYQRMNIACPQSVLSEGLERLRRAVEQLRVE